MRAELTSAQVWQAVEKNGFAVVGMVTEREGSTYGRESSTSFATIISTFLRTDTAGRRATSPRMVTSPITIPIPKRIPFLPWIRIPAATITFSATARVMAPGEAPLGITSLLLRGLENKQQMMSDSCVIEVIPEKDFITYGVGMPLFQMRRPEKARGRVSTDSTRHSLDASSGSSSATPQEGRS